MAITASVAREFVGDIKRIAGKAAASTAFYKGALVVIDGGYIGSPTDAANKVPLGVVEYVDGMEPGDQSLTTGSSAHPDITIISGRIWVPFSGAAQTDVGLLFFLADNGTVTKTAGSKTWKVPCEGFKTGYVLLNFDKLLGAAA